MFHFQVNIMSILVALCFLLVIVQKTSSGDYLDTLGAITLVSNVNISALISKKFSSQQDERDIDATTTNNIKKF